MDFLLDILVVDGELDEVFNIVLMRTWVGIK